MKDLLWQAIFPRRPKKPKHLRTGAKAERLAARFLRKQGLRILKRNLRLRFGEVDLLAREGDMLVVVEVKSLDDPAPGVYPEQSLRRDQRRRLARVGRRIAERYRLRDVPLRYDLVTVTFRPDGPVIRHHRDAFDARGNTR
ncbi:MAG: YraN family protein [Deltaproteobacteria bacterium]|nr:YraN family protein [Deltaproteobacteria bacterium]